MEIYLLSSDVLKKIPKHFKMQPASMDEDLKQLSESTGYEQGELINAAINFLCSSPHSVTHNLMGLYKFKQACLLDPDSAPMFEKRMEALLKNSGFVKLK